MAMIDDGLGKREGVPHVEPYASSQHEAEVAATVESMLQTLEATLGPWFPGTVEAGDSGGPGNELSEIAQLQSSLAVDARTAKEQAAFALESEQMLARSVSFMPIEPVLRIILRRRYHYVVTEDFG